MDFDLWIFHYFYIGSIDFVNKGFFVKTLSFQQRKISIIALLH